MKIITQVSLHCLIFIIAYVEIIELLSDTEQYQIIIFDVSIQTLNVGRVFTRSYSTNLFIARVLHCTILAWYSVFFVKGEHIRFILLSISAFLSCSHKNSNRASE